MKNDDAVDLLQRCERLLSTMADALRFERSLAASTAESDTHTRSLVRPVLEEAFARLETLRVMPAGRSLDAWVTEFNTLEGELDRIFAHRGWPRYGGASEGSPEHHGERH